VLASGDVIWRRLLLLPSLSLFRFNLHASFSANRFFRKETTPNSNSLQLSSRK